LSALLNRLWRELPRLLFCFITGVAITVTSIICAWYNFRSIHYLRWDAYETQGRLDWLADEIAHYREKTGHLPAHLTDLEAVKKETFLMNGGGRPLDWWHRPLHYEVKGDTYELYSLGRDGKPGGFGLDADLYAGKRKEFWDERHWLTLWQFLEEPETDRMKFICIGAGVVTCGIWLCGTSTRQEDRSPWPTFIWKALVGQIVIGVFAVGTAVVISALHIPTGH
jgi:hypothetical protein